MNDGSLCQYNMKLYRFELDESCCCLKIATWLHFPNLLLKSLVNRVDGLLMILLILLYSLWVNPIYNLDKLIIDINLIEMIYWLLKIERTLIGVLSCDDGSCDGSLTQNTIEKLDYGI